MYAKEGRAPIEQFDFFPVRRPTFRRIQCEGGCGKWWYWPPADRVGHERAGKPVRICDTCRKALRNKQDRERRARKKAMQARDHTQGTLFS